MQSKKLISNNQGENYYKISVISDYLGKLQAVSRCLQLKEADLVDALRSSFCILMQYMKVTRSIGHQIFFWCWLLLL